RVRPRTEKLDRKTGSSQLSHEHIRRNLLHVEVRHVRLAIAILELKGRFEFQHSIAPQEVVPKRLVRRLPSYSTVAQPYQQFASWPKHAAQLRQGLLPSHDML